MAAVIPWKLSSSKHSHLNLPQKTQWSGYTALFQSCCQVLRGLKFSGEEWYTRFQKKVLVCCQSSFTSWKKVWCLLKQCYSHSVLLKLEEGTKLCDYLIPVIPGKEEIGIEEYSFSQSTLEQVLSTFHVVFFSWACARLWDGMGVAKI